jgi:hypothetical protein
MFGFLCDFLTKFLLHFIDIHRYDSPAKRVDYLCIGSFRKLRACAIGVFFDSSYPSCTWLSHARTTMPYPTPHVVSEFRWALACLLSILLCIHHEVSRVRHVGLKRNDLGGVFFPALTALCGFLMFILGISGLPVSPSTVFAALDCVGIYAHLKGLVSISMS